MRRNLLLLLLLCCALTGWGQSAADLAQRLDRADRLLQQAEAQPATAAARVRDAQALAPAHTCPGLSAAAAHPTKKTLAQARREVHSLRAVLGIPSPAGAPSGTAHAALASVLARGDFHVLKQERFHWPAWVLGPSHKIMAQLNRFKTWAGGLFRRFGDFLRTLFGRWNPQVSQFEKVGKGLRITLYIVLAVAVALLLGFVLSRVMILSQRRKAVIRRSDGLLGEIEERVPGQPYVPPWEQALREAERLRQARETRPAMRLVLRASLILLDHRGVLTFDESRANGEVLRELRRQGRGEVHARLSVIVRTFDRGWYGFLTIPDDEFSAVLSTSRELHAHISGGA